MKQHDLSGKTADEAIAIIAEALGATPPENVQDIIRQMATIDGGRISAMIFVDKGPDVPSDAFAMSEQLALDYLNKKNGRDPVVKALFDKYGEPGPYNGVPGDSCRCDVCNLRRRVHGIILTEDMDKGVTAEESVANINGGYPNGIPKWAQPLFVGQFAIEHPDQISECIPLEEFQNWKSAREVNLSNDPLVKLFNALLH